MFFTHRLYRNRYKERRCQPFISSSTKKDEAIKEIEDTSTKNDKANKEIEDTSTRNDEANKEIEDTSTRNDEANKEIKDTSTRKDEANKEIEDTSTRKDEANEEIEDTSTRKDETKKEIKDTSTRNDEANKEIEDTSTRKDEANEEIEDTSTRNDEANKEIEDTSTRNDEANKEIEDTSTRNDEANKEIQDTSTKNDEANKEIEDTSTRNDEANKEIEDTSTRNDEANKEIEDTSTRNDETNKEIEDTSTRNDEANKEIEDTSTRNDEVNIKIKKSEVQDKDVEDISTDDHKDIIQLLKSVESIVYPEDSNTYTQYPSNDINISSLIRTPSFCNSQTHCFVVPILISSYRPVPNSSYHQPIFFHDPVVHSNVSACCDESSVKGQVISSPNRSLSPVVSSSLGVYDDSVPGLLDQNLSASDHIDSGATASALLDHSFDHDEVLITGSMDIKILDIIGQGGQATLYRLHDGQSISAAKIALAASNLKELRHEFDILSQLSHPNIVSVYKEVPRGFLLECLAQDLFSVIERYGSLPPTDRDNIALGIAEAVSHLHSCGIAHLDIKPDNILMTESGCPKLADFGLALRHSNQDGSIRYLYELHGSFEYIPPEMLQMTSPVEMLKSDSWSLGVTFFTMMAGTLPFVCDPQDQLLINQLNGNYSFTDDMATRVNTDPAYEYFMDMIESLCNIDPKARWSPSDALWYYWDR